MLQALESTLPIEASWLTHADRTGIVLSNGRGKGGAPAKAWEYVNTKFPTTFKDCDQWENTRSAVRWIHGRGWLKDFLFLIGDRCDFTDKALDNNACLDMLYRASVCFKKCGNFIPPSDLKLMMLVIKISLLLFLLLLFLLQLAWQLLFQLL